MQTARLHQETSFIVVIKETEGNASSSCLSCHVILFFFLVKDLEYRFQMREKNICASSASFVSSPMFSSSNCSSLCEENRECYHKRKTPFHSLWLMILTLLPWHPKLKNFPLFSFSSVLFLLIYMPHSMSLPDSPSFHCKKRVREWETRFFAKSSFICCLHPWFQFLITVFLLYSWLFSSFLSVLQFVRHEKFYHSLFLYFPKMKEKHRRLITLQA